METGYAPPPPGLLKKGSKKPVRTRLSKKLAYFRGLGPFLDVNLSFFPDFPLPLQP